MEHIRIKPTVGLALGALVIALLVVSRLTSGPHGPICVELPAAQPGFAALTAGANPACIRIRLR